MAVLFVSLRIRWAALKLCSKGFGSSSNFVVLGNAAYVGGSGTSEEELDSFESG